jgi:enoyl-CoA hydratase
VRLPRLIGHSRALDMILSGRSVEAKEAFEWGLANRLCRNGKGLEEALDLAELIKSFPESCMKNDRKSSYEQFSMNMADALQNEFMYGCKTLATEEYIAGSKRFSSGEGKHGKVTIIKSNL